MTVWMEALLRRELSTTGVVALGRSSGGCISDGRSFDTDSGKVFVKHNSDPKAGNLRVVGKRSRLLLFFLL